MAHLLAIAKATFAASLIKPDPESVPRDEIAQFHKHLDEVLRLSSPTNIQRCREWLVRHVVYSQGRRAALAKYLGVVTDSLKSDHDTDPTKLKASTPSLRRSCLHVLYLLNDTLHDLQHHRSASQIARELSQALEPCMKVLIRPYSTHQRQDACTRKLLELLKIWLAEQYLDAATASDLQRLATEKPEEAAPASTSIVTNGADADTKASAQFVMPSSHGDTSMPFYDLPAATMLPHIIPNSTRPLDPQLIKPLHYPPGPADKELTHAIQGFLKDADAVYARGEQQAKNTARDINQLGQQIGYDKSGKPVVENKSYYGWSLEFCRTIKNGESIVDAMSDEKTGLAGSESPPVRLHTGLGSRRSRSGSSCSSRSRGSSRSYSPPSPSDYRERSGGHLNIQNTGRPPTRSPPVDPRRRARVT